MSLGGAPRTVDPRLGGIARRFGARIFDVFLVGGVWTITVRVFTDEGTDPSSGLSYGLILGGYALLAAYEIPSTALAGRTLGKLAFGLRVVRFEGGGPPGWRASVLRFLTPVLAGLVPFVGIVLSPVLQLWFLWDPLRRNIPDKVAGTIVLHADAEWSHPPA